MKKIIFTTIIIFFAIVSFKTIVNAKNNDEQWVKISKSIYIDKKSIVKNTDINVASAYFKIYDLSKNKTLFDKIDGTPVYYKTIKYEAGCDIGALFYLHTQSYDKDNNLLYDEINNHDVGADCDAYYKGEIICKALCDK